MKITSLFLHMCVCVFFAFTITGCKSTLHQSKTKLEVKLQTVKLLNSAKGQTSWQKLHLVNSWVNNAMQQSEDLTIWHIEDYWASPIEALAKGAADCEDFALTKYFLLREAGVPANQLFLSHVDYQYQIAPHMVLVFYDLTDSGYYVLDNIVTDIKPSIKRQDLQFKYSFNENKVFTGRPVEFKDIKNSSPDQISNWAKVLRKWKKEKHGIALKTTL